MEEDNLVATESALGALGKLIYFQRQTLPSIITDQVVIEGFLNKLPLLNEEEEAQKSHRILMEQVIKGNPNIMGSATTKQAVQQALTRIKVAT